MGGNVDMLTTDVSTDCNIPDQPCGTGQHSRIVPPPLSRNGNMFDPNRNVINGMPCQILGAVGACVESRFALRHMLQNISSPSIYRVMPTLALIGLQYIRRCHAKRVMESSDMEDDILVTDSWICRKVTRV